MTQNTSLSPIIRKYISDEYVKLRREKVIIWAYLHSSHPFSCDDFFKRPIKYQGIRFEGLPRYVFWNGFIEPFLKHISYQAIDRSLEICKAQKSDARYAIRETCDLLKKMVRNIYEEMAEVDLLLRKERNTNDLEKMDVSKKIAAMDLIIDQKAYFELLQKNS